jgi:NiFe hydrogenase small subunit HydA
MPNQTGTPKPTIEQHLKTCGVSRRSFLQLCSAIMVTAPMGMALTEKAGLLQVADAIGKAKRPSVIWLHFQDCTGCTETLLRTLRPDVADLILNVISLDDHETLMAASGAQAEAALRSAIDNNAGKYVLVVEGAIPAKRGSSPRLQWPASRLAHLHSQSKLGAVTCLCKRWKSNPIGQKPRPSRHPV